MEEGRRTRLVTVAVLVTVFLSGLLLGLALERTLLAGPPPSEERTERDRERGRDGRGGLIVERVGLDSMQNERVDSIVRGFRADYRSLQREMRERYEPGFEALVDSTRAAIMEVLTPEQAAQYDSLLTEADRERERRRDHEGERRGRR